MVFLCSFEEKKPEDSEHKLGRWDKSHSGGHDMVRRVDRNEMFGLCARTIRTQIDDSMQAGETGDERFWNMIRRIKIIDEEGVLPATREDGHFEEKKEESPERNAKRLREEFDVWDMLEDGGALPLLREFQAVYEKNFLSSWLREDVKVKRRRGRG